MFILLSKSFSGILHRKKKVARNRVALPYIPFYRKVASRFTTIYNARFLILEPNTYPIYPVLIKPAVF